MDTGGGWRGLEEARKGRFRRWTRLECAGRKADAGDDPLIGEFLGFLAQDIAAHPERVQALDAAFVDRLQTLVGEVEIDLDSPLPPNAD